MDRFRALVPAGTIGHPSQQGGSGHDGFLDAPCRPETTLLSVITAYLTWGMVAASPGEGGREFGAAGVSSDGGSGRSVPEDKLGILRDKLALSSARALAKRTVELARIMKK